MKVPPFISLAVLTSVSVVMMSGCATSTPKLNDAIRQDNFVEARKLIETGADVNSVDGIQSTPLLLASEKGESRLASLLIKKGANVNWQNEKGWTPINIAAANGHTETVILLIKNGASANTTAGNGHTPLIDAASKRHTKTAKALIQNGANVNCLSSAGDTPLIIASVKGDIELATLLIQAGADVDFADRNGNTPLILANKYAYQKIAELLLQNGANPSLINEKMREIERKNKAESREFWKGAATLATGVAVGKATSGYTPDQQTRMMSSSMKAVDSGDTSELTQTTNQVKAEQAQSHKAKMQAIEAQKERDRAAQAQDNRVANANVGSTAPKQAQLSYPSSTKYRCVEKTTGGSSPRRTEAAARAEALQYTKIVEGGMGNLKTISTEITSCKYEEGLGFTCHALTKYERDSSVPCGGRTGPSGGKSK